MVDVRSCQSLMVLSYASVRSPTTQGDDDDEEDDDLVIVTVILKCL